MLKRKSIVLSDIDKNSNKKAVLALQEDEVGVRGTLRLYNFSHDLNGVSSLGFYVDQKVYKAGLTWKSNMLYEFFIDIKEIPNKFSCAVVNFQNAEASPILYGSSEGSNDDIYGSIITEIAAENSLKNTEKVLNKYGVDFDQQEKQQIEKEIDEAMCNENCSSCIYKKYFFENVQKETEEFSNVETVAEKKFVEENQEEKQNSFHEQEKSEIVFFDKLKPQIDRLFAEHPAEDNLQNLIPSSKWVKVEYEEEGDFYVFGLLYDENENVRYVCYGVPAVFEQEPPKELEGYPIWLPLNKNNSSGFGYWLTYQDASTGEPVKAILE